jgi:putative thiamine transport system ATP-binding protein
LPDETTAGLRLDAVRIRLDGRELVAVDSRVRPGETLTVMGPSGSGKSTLLAYVGGFLDPVFAGEGRVICGGRDIANIPAQERHAGILFQDPLLFPHMSVGGNLVFAIPGTIKPENPPAAPVPRPRWPMSGWKVSTIAIPIHCPAARKRVWRLPASCLPNRTSCCSTNPFPSSTCNCADRSAPLFSKSARRSRLPVILVTHDEADASAAGGDVIEIG